MSLLQVAPEFAGAAHIGWLEMSDLKVEESSGLVQTMLRDLAADYRRRYAGGNAADIPNIKKIREIFHIAGVDPTRYRPSSEALFRRAIQGKDLYLINSIVDLVNYFSLQLLCPMGLYDADQVKPPVEWRIGREQEFYQGIGRGQLHLHGFPLLVDAVGPFGSPISDSVRTQVRNDSRHILWIIFAPPGSTLDLDEFARTALRFNGGRVVRMDQWDV